MATKSESLKMIIANCHSQADEGSTSVWAMLLAPYDDLTVQKATISLLQTIKQKDFQYGRLPVFSVMQEELDKITGSVRNSDNIALQAEAEWLKYPEYLRAYVRSKPYTQNPTTELVIQAMGGWETVRMWETQYLSLKKKEFCDLWQQYYGNEQVLNLGSSTVSLIDSPSGKSAVIAQNTLPCINPQKTNKMATQAKREALMNAQDDIPRPEGRTPIEYARFLADKLKAKYGYEKSYVEEKSQVDETERKRQHDEYVARLKAKYPGYNPNNPAGNAAVLAQWIGENASKENNTNWGKPL